MSSSPSQSPSPGLPDDSRDDVSLFAVIKSVVAQLSAGADLVRISLPAMICYPYTLLEAFPLKRVRGMRILELLNTVEDPLARIVVICSWYLACMTEDEFAKKPLNPLLGEVFSCKTDDPEDDTHFFAEQVCHHPPISAFHFEKPGSNIGFAGAFQMSAKFGGNSVAASFSGSCELYVRNRNEVYTFKQTMPDNHTNGLLLGKRRNEWGGVAGFFCEQTGYSASIEFKTQGLLGGERNKIQGKITHKDYKFDVATFEGYWTGQVDMFMHKKVTKPDLSFLKDKKVHDYANVKTPGFIVLPKEGCVNSQEVWKPVTDAIRARNYELADIEKKKIEDAQRERNKTRETEFVPSFFVKNEIAPGEIKPTWVIKPEALEDLLKQ